MASKICPCCGETFQPHHKVPNQTYCSSRDCQRERRQLWDRKKQQSDPEYRDNKNRVQRAWTERNSDLLAQVSQIKFRHWRKNRPKPTTNCPDCAIARQDGRLGLAPGYSCWPLPNQASLYREQPGQRWRLGRRNHPGVHQMPLSRRRLSRQDVMAFWQH